MTPTIDAQVIQYWAVALIAVPIYGLVLLAILTWHRPYRQEQSDWMYYGIAAAIYIACVAAWPLAFVGLVVWGLALLIARGLRWWFARVDNQEHVKR